ncbi:hypothetical protein [Nocardioides sp.]|uniref:hypothetical protein n=1 Tax=Nocardioides sp. TaxID=35761 RepID=UPI0039E52CC5
MKRLLVISLLASGIVGAAPAFAADVSGCGGTKLCLYKDNGFQAKFSEREENKPLWNFAVGNRNTLDSWANNSDVYDACGYDGLDGTGDTDNWQHNHNDDDVAPWNSDDKESATTKTGC